MPTFGSGPWRSEQLQDKRWRRAVESLTNPTLPQPQRLKAARKILRDGNDLACCMLFSVCQTHAPNGQWGHQHPYDAIRGAVRFRALRILGQPSRHQGRDHHAAALLLPWIIKPRDHVIVHRLLQTNHEALMLPALHALGRVISAVDMSQTALPDTLRMLVEDEQLSAAVHTALAQALSQWTSPAAQTLLAQGAAHHAHVLRWPHLEMLLQRAPDIGGPLAAAHLESLGVHHIHAADVRAALDRLPTPRQ